MELKVENILKLKGVEYGLIKLSQKAYTVSDVIKYSENNINAEEVCKTIILKGKTTGKKHALLLRGGNKINFSAVKKNFEEEITIASEKDVEEAGGVEPGAVCPFLLKIPLFVDRRVLDLEKINCGSGNHLYGLEFRSKDLNRVVEYKTVDWIK